MCNFVEAAFSKAETFHENVLATSTSKFLYGYIHIKKFKSCGYMVC